MINLDKILEDYSNQIGGKYVPYTDNQSFVIVPTKQGRFQKVYGWSNQTKTYKFLEFNSKVCEYKVEMDLSKLLESAADLVFSRLMIKEGFIYIASSVVVDHANPEIIKDMVNEVAEIADSLEFTLTGEDNN